MIGHSEKAAQFLKDENRADWHDQTLWMVRQKRDRAAWSVPEWEDLREEASQIKNHALSNLDNYLLQFEEKVIGNGATIHWASDAQEFNDLILRIIQKNGAKKIVKSKSMLTEECGLNPFLEKNGLEVVDTDLGERIIQFRNEPPSHIVLPAIHLKKEEIGELFEEKLKTAKGNSDPQYLTAAARSHLREKFLAADVAITGVNFAIADTGTVVVCTNEGNADMGVHAAKIQIHCMGIEKIIPGTNELAVFTRMLARSATGQPITTYTSHYREPKAGGQMHVVIVDNGRSKLLGNETYRNSLKCIRCGACMNTCPVYRRSGGHSYNYVIPGPIGSILGPDSDINKFKDLPFVSTLCGSCTNVCPVKINIHDLLYDWRQEISEKKLLPLSKRYLMKITGIVLAHNTVYNLSGKVARWAIRNLSGELIYHRINVWGRERELPEVPRESFKQWYRKNTLERRSVNEQG